MPRRTTLEIHTTGGVLDPRRGALHARIIEEVLGDVTERAQRKAVLYAGGPASGKSRLRAAIGPAHAAGFVVIDPDVVRTKLPEYRELVAAGDPEAARLTHDEASLIAKTATDVAISLGLSLVIDAVGGDDRGQFSSKIRRLLDAGYELTVRYVTLPLELAQEREAARAAETGRAVPADVVRSKHAEVSRGFHHVARIAGIRLEIYDNRGDEPMLIAEGFGDPSLGSDGLNVHHPDGYHRFLEKARE
jgi:predicted ABC-type ATPase